MLKEHSKFSDIPAEKGAKGITKKKRNLSAWEKGKKGPRGGGYF